MRPSVTALPFLLFCFATMLPLEANGTTLKTFVPALAKDVQSDWYQGPATLCVETDGQRTCSQLRPVIETPAVVAGQPGDVMVQSLERSNKVVLDSAGIWASAQQVSDLQAMSAQALKDLRQKIVDAVAGHPQKTTVTLDDGQTVTVAFDLAAIRKMEALTAAGQSYLNGVLQPLVERIQKVQQPAAIDLTVEQQLRDFKTAHETMEAAGKYLTALQLLPASAALVGCIAFPPSCFALAAAVSTWAHYLAYASILKVSTVVGIEILPNSLDSLTTVPSGSIDLPSGTSQPLDVRGRFVSTLDSGAGDGHFAKKAATKVISRWVDSALGLGFATSYLVEQTLRPVVDLTVNSILDLGLRDLLRIETGLFPRDVSLSSNTVNSSCLHGSSPQPGTSWILGTDWVFQNFQGITSAQPCDFWASDKVLWVRGGAPSVSLVVRTKSPDPSNCAIFPAEKLVPFESIYSVSASIPNRDRVVVAKAPQAPRSPFSVIAGNNAIELPLPRFQNERYCSPVQLAPGCTADAYVPTQDERLGRFSPFAGVLYDPATCRVVNGATVCSPFPGGTFRSAVRVPAALLGGACGPRRAAFRGKVPVGKGQKGLGPPRHSLIPSPGVPCCSFVSLISA